MRNGNVTGQEQIALQDDVNLDKQVQRSGSNSFTLPVNVDTMLANGSDSWRYDKVRLEVTRVAAAGTTEIGASAVADYSVKQRLPGISAPSSITRVNGETDNADALLYTVSWSPSDDARIDHYDLCVVDDGGNTCADAAHHGQRRQPDAGSGAVSGQGIALPRHCPPQGW